MIILYNIFLCFLFIIFIFFLPFILLFSKKRRANILQRLGIINIFLKKKSEKKRIWIHALSFGEVKSAYPLIKALEKNKKDFELIFTASTKTGFDKACNLFLKKKNSMVNQVGYFPFDFLFSLRQICSRIEPDIVLIIETDLWPNFLLYMRKRKIPVFLVNARLSHKSFKKYLWFKNFIGFIFSLFSIVMVQTNKDKIKFKKLGINANKIKVLGNIKFDQSTPEISENHIQLIKKQFKKKTKIFIAGSTHKGEEEILVNCFLKLKNQFNDFSMIIAPRDIKRANQIKKIFFKKKVNSVLITDIEKKSQKKSCYVVIIDIMGILAGLYKVCDIAFIGGSLVKSGGHNPLEPAFFSKPIFFGPYMTDFSLISEMLIKNKGGFMVLDKYELIKKTKDILADKVKANHMGSKAEEIFLSNKGAVKKTVKQIYKWLSD
ncbi:MAG: hypothetical protein B6I26_01085 [Desulfobacteraceae bacterium 4572_130]|nr:MAG: hypothetical protein B6I26_01085 [Desulfobacteraceae bacterium 4572_130]